MVRFERIPPVADRQRVRRPALSAPPDHEIDFSDIPPITDDEFAQGVRGLFYRPNKQQLTIRLDADVLAWLKAGGKGWQTALNFYLRQAMQQDLTARQKR